MLAMRSIRVKAYQLSTSYISVDTVNQQATENRFNLFSFNRIMLNQMINIQSFWSVLCLWIF